MKKYFLSQLNTVCGRHRKSLCKNYDSRDGNKFFFNVNQFPTIYSTICALMSQQIVSLGIYVLASEQILLHYVSIPTYMPTTCCSDIVIEDIFH